MNIFVIGKFNTEAFGSHIAETLETMGHSVTRHEIGVHQNSTATVLRKRLRQATASIYDLAKQLRGVRARETRVLLDVAKRARADLVIVTHDFLLPDQVRDLRDATGASVVLWFPDHIARFGKAFFLNAPYDALFFKDPYIVHTLRRDLQLSVYYLPECCNPRYHTPVPLTDSDRARFQCEITTAGNLYPNRIAFFSRLADYDVKIWGHPPALWLDTSPVRQMLHSTFVAGPEKAKAFRAAKIVLNNLHPAEIWGVNTRAFEIAAVGGFQMVNWRLGTAQLFEEGREIVSFSDHVDLRIKLDHYLHADTERAQIAEAASARALRDHTYERRLGVLLRTMTEGSGGYPMPDLGTTYGSELSSSKLRDGAARLSRPGGEDSLHAKSARTALHNCDVFGRPRP